MKKDIVQHLEQIADLLELKNENPFKIGAFRNAARIVAQQTDNILEMIESGALAKVKGIGKSTFHTIAHFCNHGTSPVFLELTENIPGSIFDLMTLRGLGVKKTAMLFNELQISGLPQLSAAINDGRIFSVKGFSEKFVQQLQIEIERVTAAKTFVYIHQAYELSDHLQYILSGCPSVIRMHETGELLKIREVFNSLAFTVLVEEREKFLDELNGKIGEFSMKENAICIEGLDIPITIYITASIEEFTQTIVDNTIDHALDDAYTRLHSRFNNLTDFPFPLLDTGYYAVDTNAMDYVVSNLHPDNIKGMLHFHTLWSDGINSLEEMVQAGKEFGYQYFAVTDHSKTASYANGLSENRVLLQRDEIALVSKKCGVTVFGGIESDILTDGSLDYPDEFLKTFDIVVASVHSQFNQEKKTMTSRIVKAVEHPHVHILGHPTGRLLLRREGYAVDMKKVIDACAANGTAIELNANPLRLDIDWRWLPYAVQKGCIFAINADAHSAESIPFVQYGIKIAQKGGLQEDRVINYFTEAQFRSFLQAK